MSRPKYPSDVQDQFVLRLPDGMRDEIKTAALANGRTMNAEIVARLSGQQRTLRDDYAIAALIGLLSHASGEDPRKAPKLAVELADAMLRQREVQP